MDLGLAPSWEDLGVDNISNEVTKLVVSGKKCWGASLTKVPSRSGVSK